MRHSGASNFEPEIISFAASRTNAQTADPSRRGFLRLGAGVAISGLLHVPPLPAARGLKFERLLVRFRTSPARLKRMLPPPLEAADGADAWMEYLRLTPGNSVGGLILPGPYLVAAAGFAVHYEGRRGWYQPIRWTTSDWLRIFERESLGWNTKSARIHLEVEGAQVRASLHRDGLQLHHLETVRTDGSYDGPTPETLGSFLYRYRLHPDSSQGVFAGPNPQLWRQPAQPETESSLDGAAQSVARHCDLETTTCSWAAASPRDPLIELPIREILSISFHEGTTGVYAPETIPSPEKITTLDGKSFAAWSFLNYDRPVTSGQAWRPEGWREKATAFRFSPRELEAYRERSELRLGPCDLVDIRLAADNDAASSVLPPPCQDASRRMLRLLALRVEESDISPEPFTEVWLLAYCVAKGVRGWYALSHIAGPGGDAIFGREVYGYPSKFGDIDLSISFVDFGLDGFRLGRHFLSAQGAIRGMATGTTLSRMEVFGLRAGLPISGARAHLIAQHWDFQGRRQSVDRSAISVQFPEEAVAKAASRSDPWFEFASAQVLSASIMSGAYMQRGPGRVLAEVPDFIPYYRERCDGVVPGVDAAESAPAPSFHVRTAPVTRSESRTFVL